MTRVSVTLMTWMTPSGPDTACAHGTGRVTLWLVRRFSGSRCPMLHTRLAAAAVSIVTTPGGMDG